MIRILGALLFVFFTALPISISAQTYAFDTLLVYEVIPHDEDKRPNVVSQLINSQDNSYYAILERTEAGEIELYFTIWDENKYITSYIAVREFQDGDEVMIKKSKLKRLGAAAKRDSGFIVKHIGDTIVDGKRLEMLDFVPQDASKKQRKLHFPSKILLSTESGDFKTNFWRGFPLDGKKMADKLPNGRIEQIHTMNHFNFKVSSTFLMKSKPLKMTIVLE